MTPKFTNIMLAPVPVEIELAADNDNGGSLPTFKMTAYTGVAVNAFGLSTPMVIDLSGTEIPKQQIPVRFQHDPLKGVGHTTEVTKTKDSILTAGVISRDTEWAKDVVSASQNGFPWQVSIGGPIHEVEFFDEKTTVTVNGKQFKGNIYVVRKMTLKEVSFVDIGADSNTSATVELSYDNPSNQLEGVTMPVTKPVTNSANSSETQAVMENAANLTLSANEPQATPEPTVPKPAAAPSVQLSNEYQQQLILNQNRIAAIGRVGGGKLPTLEAQAIEENWTVEKFQGELNAKLMPNAANIQMSGDSGKGLSSKALEVIALRAAGGGIGFIEKHYEPQTLELADKFSGVQLQEFIELACGGKYLPKYQRSPGEWLQAAFSSMSLPGILANTTNKILLESFESRDNQWKKIVDTASVNNFLKHDRYRLTSDFTFKKVGADGELKHGKVGEESYSQQADTYGIMFSITRKDLINDDLSALTRIPRMIGIGAGDALNRIVWTSLLSNPVQKDGKAFFHADHKNLLTGESLDIDGMTEAELKFMLQESTPGIPLGIMPKYLVVPAALKVAAERLMKSQNVVGGDETTLEANPHAGKFEIVATTFLQSQAFPGSSAASWYLFADPQQLPAIEVAFLNGKQQPTVERAEADFNVLGIQFRGYHDFGVAMQDYRAAVKITS